MEWTNRIKGVFSIVATVRENSNRIIEEELKRRGIEGIVPAHGVVLAALFEAGEPIPLKRIAERSGRVKSTITGMVRTLEKYGYVERTASDTDGRSWDIALTKKGELMQGAAESISDGLLGKAWEGFTPAEQQTLVELLERLRDNLSTPGSNTLSRRQ